MDDVHLKSPLPVDPATFPFRLSTFAGETVRHHALDHSRASRRGKFFVALNVRDDDNSAWSLKRPLGLSTAPR